MNKFIVKFKRNGEWQVFCNWVTGMPVLFANFSLADLQAQNLREGFNCQHAQAVPFNS